MDRTPYQTLIPDTLDFVEQLARNNSRDWFAAHKPEYEAKLKRPASLLLEEAGVRLETLTGLAVRPKMYRIHRDLRFSRDKTPYNTHLHLQWSAASGPPIAWLFGVSRAYVCAGMGVMGFSPAQLSAWRAGIDGKAGAALGTLLAGLLDGGHRMDDPALKRVPPPYDKDHARGDLLRRKGLVLWHDLEASAQADPAGALIDTATRLEPLRKALSAMLPP